MQNSEICILTEGGKNIGFGHIMRCLSLYEAFKESGVVASFVVNGDKSVESILKKINGKITNWLKNQTELLNCIEKANIVVLDSYLADKKIYDLISKSAKIPVYIDDNARIEYPEGVIINGNIGAESLEYKKTDKQIYLLGTKYALLRKEFWNVEEKIINQSVKSIMITFGGDDLRCMTPDVLGILSKAFSNLKKYVIIGKGFNEIGKIESAADAETSLIYHPDAETMKEIMVKSDIAVSAAGQTLYELARVGVPTVAVGVADNQRVNITGWKDKGFIKFAGWWNEERIFDNILQCIDELLPFLERKKVSEAGKGTIDGMGPKRILQFIRFNLNNF